MTAPLVRIEGLRIVARQDDGGEMPIVENVDLTVGRGEVLALIGESGSGKTTIALSMLGYARPGCRIAGGQIEVAGLPVHALDARELRDLRGRTVAYVAQSAAAAFNPARTIMSQVIESALIHGTLTEAEAEEKARGLFRALALPDPDGVGARYPHQVSGGQLQRLLAAMALITDPELVIFDEPTTALDVTTQIEVLKAFKAVVRERNTTAVYVTHDLAVVAQIADRIVVLRNGAVQETGDTGQILSAPTHDYSRALLAAAAPRERGEGSFRERSGIPLLELKGLVAGYGGTDGAGNPRTRILDDVSVSIRRGSILGVIGESGCGKSTLARVIAGLHPAAKGEVLLDGTPMAPALSARTKEELQRVQLVFQIADTALNPASTVRHILARPLIFYRRLSGAALRAEVNRLLDLVHLPRRLADRYPAELSGGQKQRVNLARALAAEPDLVLCDEVTSALDPVVAAAVLDLLVELRAELGVAYMFISHDLETVRSISDEVMVLYGGVKVEAGDRASLQTPPHHPYSRLLMSSVPELRQGWLEEAGRSYGRALGRAAAQPGGCNFFPRCDLAIPGRCDVLAPPRWQVAGREIACHRSADDLCAAADEAARLGTG
ncbi:ABC transporter [Sphingomonas oleivorans]|uniref:ABC transporter n=1 Tax=Sphingomonas oleivorans TaxID=1735121 RepID=A0A2T5G0L5_9SPHN|nr:ABC transporter ATP-binding protein [Sphingomonas oleivorans]PTQ12696.1 ABC transporter [Sphingomonas oleivorans]